MTALGDPPRTIVMFYDGYEVQALDHPFGKLRSDIRAIARQTWRGIRRKQPFTGYYAAFLNLKAGLETLGHSVRVNDFAFARAHPEETIGISGYPSVFGRVRLPNPAVFGPGYVPPPGEVEAVVDSCNLRILTLPSEWPCKIWRPALGDLVQPMCVPIDVAEWPDLSGAEKTIDAIVYDKIRWNRTKRSEDVLAPIFSLLEANSRSYVTLSYGRHHISQFREALKKARSMIFVCEHETQGLAYQEAMASGVPILAWDEGVLVDPNQKMIAPADLVVSSVPYFEERCGMKFTRLNLPQAFRDFWDQIETFAPRDYVEEALSPAVTATRYLQLLKFASIGAATGSLSTSERQLPS